MGRPGDNDPRCIGCGNVYTWAPLKLCPACREKLDAADRTFRREYQGEWVEPTYVLALNKNDARCFAMEHKLENWRYVAGRDDLRGLRNPKVVRTMRYLDRLDYEEMERELLTRYY